jgi:large subunit ribosomal protein L2
MLKKFKPTSPGIRNTILLKKPKKVKNINKKLLLGKKNKSGRNYQGKITVWGRGSGHAKKTRILDFWRNGLNGTVKRIEYDPNRSANIAYIQTNDNNFFYIIAPENLKKNDFICSDQNASLNRGHTLPLKNIPIGTLIHNVELFPGQGGKLARSAGTKIQLINLTPKHAILKLPSNKYYYVSKYCRGTIGTVSNPDLNNTSLGKAGRNRWLNKRPKTRGVAINPVDHPHGGGNGKTSGGRHPVTPWGKLTKGKPTRNKKKKIHNSYGPKHNI